ncbi:MAG TPA: serine/threonine-protein kinase [Polyangiaceae bacterium]|nr:serine/threonine-protein kinase [Polyangiaceae bacterium]
MTQALSSQPIQVGEVVAGKYRVDRVLGEGGMGIVVAATHLHLEQRVALKFLLPAMAANAEVVQRFLREARAAVKIQSEHVAKGLDVGTHQGAPYMVMEYLEGGDLAQVLAERGALPVAEAVGYLLEACEAVAEAHALGIVHRDLKPSNLFLARGPAGKPSVKVLDFGISKAPATGDDPNLTKTSAIMGSPSYMSPEQLVSSASVDMRSDIWALGVVLYEMLTRTVPFTAQSMPELVGAILQCVPQPIAVARHGVPAGIQAVVDRCLQKTPSTRFGNVAELARALLAFGPSRSEQSVERIEHVLRVSGTPLVFGRSHPNRSEGPASTFSPATSQALRPASRWLLWSVAAGGIGLVAAATATAMALRRPSSLSAAARAAASHPPPTTASSPTEAPASTAVAPQGSSGLAGSKDAGSGAASASISPDSAPAAGAPLHVASSSPKPAASMARSAAPAPPTSPPEPSCRTVSYFDTEGNKHFREQCR